MGRVWFAQRPGTAREVGVQRVRGYVLRRLSQTCASPMVRCMGGMVCVVAVRGLSLEGVCTPALGCRCRGLWGAGGACSVPSITRSALRRADMAVSRAPRLPDLILFISARAEPARAGSLKAPSITVGGDTGGCGRCAGGGAAGCKAFGRTPGKSTGYVERRRQGLETRAERRARRRASRGDLARCPGGRPYFISPRC